MGDYLKIDAGVPKDANANDASAGAGDAGKLVKLNGSGKIDASMMPAGLIPEQRTIPASENLSAGDVVNIHDSSGGKVRKADATTTGKEAHGFVLAAVTSGQDATVYPEEAVISGLVDLVPGQRYFLSTVAGVITDTAPSSSGNVCQVVGVALSETELLFRPDTPIVLA